MDAIDYYTAEIEKINGEVSLLVYIMPCLVVIPL